MANPGDPRDDSSAREEFDKPTMYPPPSDYKGPLFKLRNDYPRESTETESDHPWLKVDFRTEPKRYIELLLDYCFEGMPECDFVAQDNRVISSVHHCQKSAG
jgi:hypothetical protein